MNSASCMVSRAQYHFRPPIKDHDDDDDSCDNTGTHYTDVINPALQRPPRNAFCFNLFAPTREWLSEITATCKKPRPVCSTTQPAPSDSPWQTYNQLARL